MIGDIDSQYSESGLLSINNIEKRYFAYRLARNGSNREWIGVLSPSREGRMRFDKAQSAPYFATPSPLRARPIHARESTKEWKRQVPYSRRLMCCSSAPGKACHSLRPFRVPDSELPYA
ncbi:MAG TPA: hypothetical protein VK839_07750 [Erythrobacter sp.]|nr:hypothetical protein [Erythrobacter sp.]